MTSVRRTDIPVCLRQSRNPSLAHASCSDRSRFSDPESWRDVEEISGVYGVFATGRYTYDRFEGEYLLRKSGFELSVDEDGNLFKRAVLNSSNYRARLWDIDTDNEPLFLDWAIGF